MKPGDRGVRLAAPCWVGVEERFFFPTNLRETAWIGLVVTAKDMFVKFLLREIRWFFGRPLPSSQNVRRRMGKREEIPPPAVRIFRVGKHAVHSRGVVNRIRHVFFFGGNRRAAGGVFFGEEVSRKGRKIEMGAAASHQKNFFNTHTQITPLKTATKKEAFFQHTREECFPTIPPRNHDETPQRTPRNRTFFNMRVHVYFFT